MKAKISVLVILFFSSVSLVIAQFSSLGIAVGPSFSSPSLKNLSGLKKAPYTDAVLSISGTYKIDPKFSVVLDVGVCNRGMTLKQAATVASYDPISGDTSYRAVNNKYRHSFSYLDNTLLARYTLGGKFKLYANVGVYYSFLLSKKKLIVDQYYDSFDVRGIAEVHGKYDNGSNYAYKKSDLGIAVGFGVQRGRFGLDYRYYIGTKQVSKDPAVLSLHHSFSTLKVTVALFERKNEVLPHAKAHKQKAR